MGIIITGVLCILFSIAFHYIDKYTKFNKLPYIVKQIIIGVSFGVVASMATALSLVDTNILKLNTPPNVRDSAPITAGLLFGGPAGLIAGVIGGIFRFFVGGEATQIACTIATIFAGGLAALLRKFMFDNKKPTIFYGVGITVVCEVFHMLIIFMTFQADTSEAFDLVRTLTFPMILCNAIIVGVILLINSLINKEKLFIGREKHIANTFQRWLLLFILLAYILTSWYTFFLQTGIAEKQTINSINSTIEDIKNEINDYSEETMLKLTKEIKNVYVERSSQLSGGSYKNPQDVVAELKKLKSEYDVTEINIISSKGIIFASTNEEYIGYDMHDYEQSNLFFSRFARETEYVQEYMPTSFNENVLQKYAGVKIEYQDESSIIANEYIIQVGIGEARYMKHLTEAVERSTMNRHIGIQDPLKEEEKDFGFIAVCTNEVKLITTGESANKKLSLFGIDITEKLLEGQLYKANVIIDDDGNTVKYYFSFIQNEGEENYYVIGAIPLTEAMYSRDSALYISTFMQIIIFAVLFLVVYVLIKKLIIDNLQKINSKLGEITSGNLDVVVDVKTNEEFSSLSNDINITVDTLKNYIAEAAARIDKELEYAKSIQLSALPRNTFEEEKRFDISATMIAAKEVGGDFYDYYMLDEDHVAFLVADVSGKGIPAAMFMMTSKTIIKDLAENKLEVNDVFTKANEKLCENNESGMFVTAWMGILNLKTGLLKYANAGHNPPIILHNDGKQEYLKSRPGFVLAGMEGIKYRVGEMILSKGDRIFLYTDGVTEATNLNEELYGESRLLSFMNENKETDTTKLLIDLKGNIDEFVGEAPQFDDITMLLFTYNNVTEVKMKQKTFKANDNELSNVIGFMEEELEKVDCPMKVVMGMTVAIEEVFINVAHYAYPNEEGDVSFEFIFNEKEREITIKMIDKGIPFNPLQKEDPDISLSAEERQIGGLGIFITKKTMDELTYEYKDKQNILTMKKKI